MKLAYWCLEPKFHGTGTFSGWEKKCGHTHKQTNAQDSCFKSVDIMIYQTTCHTCLSHLSFICPFKLTEKLKKSQGFWQEMYLHAIDISKLCYVKKLPWKGNNDRFNRKHCIFNKKDSTGIRSSQPKYHIPSTLVKNCDW